MCSHMFLVLARYRLEMLDSAHRAELFHIYCHSAYLLENGVKAFDEQEIHISLKSDLDQRPLHLVTTRNADPYLY